MCNATQSCALVDDEAVADSASITARFGCWTCTVVRKDKSLEALIESGYKDLQVLLDFRNRIRDVSDSPDCRSKTRRNGVPGLGPLTIAARRELLHGLLEAQSKTGMELITEAEIRLIREQWALDESVEAIRNLRYGRKNG